jgi:CsoR family transcriptional regulator, copper-sensing transcriptional repressor
MARHGGEGFIGQVGVPRGSGVFRFFDLWPDDFHTIRKSGWQAFSPKQCVFTLWSNSGLSLSEIDVNQHPLSPSARLTIPIQGICIQMKNETRSKVLGRIKRITGQVGGIQRMIEEDRYCVDILNQISAVRSALDALGVELLANHLQTCVIGSSKDDAHPTARPMKPQALVAEVQHVLSRFLR